MFEGSLDSNIDYAQLQTVSLLTNKTGQTSLIMQSRESIIEQSLHDDKTITLVSAGSMAKVF